MLLDLVCKERSSDWTWVTNARYARNEEGAGWQRGPIYGPFVSGADRNRRRAAERGDIEWAEPANNRRPPGCKPGESELGLQHETGVSATDRNNLLTNEFAHTTGYRTQSTVESTVVARYPPLSTGRGASAVAQGIVRRAVGLEKIPKSWGAEISEIGFAASVQPVGNLTVAEGRPRHRILPGLEIPCNMCVVV